jgi:hypothetical protein
VNFRYLRCSLNVDSSSPERPIPRGAPDAISTSALRASTPIASDPTSVRQPSTRYRGADQRTPPNGSVRRQSAYANTNSALDASAKATLNRSGPSGQWRWGPTAKRGQLSAGGVGRRAPRSPHSRSAPDARRHSKRHVADRERKAAGTAPSAAVRGGCCVKASEKLPNLTGRRRI